MVGKATCSLVQNFYEFLPSTIWSVLSLFCPFGAFWGRFILLIAEIYWNLAPVDIVVYPFFSYLEGFINPSSCRISSINSGSWSTVLLTEVVFFSMAFPWVSSASCWKKTRFTCVRRRRFQRGFPPRWILVMLASWGARWIENRKTCGKNPPNLCGFLPLVVGALQCWNCQPPPAWMSTQFIYVYFSWRRLPNCRLGSGITFLMVDIHPWLTL